MSAKLYIGTSGWSYPTGEGSWRGRFYPPGTRNELSYYSEFFNAVEINSSFYAPIIPAYAIGWVKKTPPDFKFTAKLWQKFTHPKMFEDTTGEVAAISSQDVYMFRKGIEPLADSGKLGALLVQFPSSFMNSGNSLRIINAVIKTFGEYPLAFELRDRSWSDDPATGEMFNENHVAWVEIDEPAFPSSITSILPVTSDIAYLRFHGRNYQDWWSGNNETRYKYLYSEQEIAQLATKVEAQAAQTRLLFAFFNNHYQGYAPRNAVELKKQLSLFKSEQRPLQ